MLFISPIPIILPARCFGRAILTDFWKGSPHMFWWFWMRHTSITSSRTIIHIRWTTFSKDYGLAGMRLGYGMGHQELIESLDRVRTPFNTSRPAQSAALAALEDHDHVARSVEINRRERHFLSEELMLMGVRFTPSVANFLLIDTGRDCEQDFLKLLQERVIVRPMKVYNFPTSLRVTIGTHEDNEVFLEALNRVMVTPVRISR